MSLSRRVMLRVTWKTTGRFSAIMYTRRHRRRREKERARERERAGNEISWQKAQYGLINSTANIVHVTCIPLIFTLFMLDCPTSMQSSICSHNILSIFFNCPWVRWKTVDGNFYSIFSANYVNSFAHSIKCSIIVHLWHVKSCITKYIAMV